MDRCKLHNDKFVKHEMIKFPSKVQLRLSLGKEGCYNYMIHVIMLRFSVVKLLDLK